MGEVTFAGYAAIFDVADRGGDVVRRGAIRHGSGVPLLWQHRGTPIGRVLKLAEDRRGLRVIGTVSDPQAARLLRAKAIDGLSFGYRVVEARQAGPVRELRAVDLMEISLVAAPMQRSARIHSIMDRSLVE